MLSGFKAFLYLSSVISLLLTPAGSTPIGTPSTFAVLPFVSFDQPVISMAANTERLLITRQCDNRVFAFDSVANQSVFTSLPDLPACKAYLAISAGGGGFPPNFVYVALGRSVFQATPNGAHVRVLTDIPLAGEASGITFDRVGSFGFDLLVTSTGGEVWRINQSGSSSRVTQLDVSLPIQNPAVVPLNTFSVFGGHVFVAAPNAERVFAVSPTGVASVVTALVGAWGVHVIPDQPCGLGQSGGAFFLARILGNHDIEIARFPASDFGGLGGNAIVTIGAFGAGPFIILSDDPAARIALAQDYTGDQAATFVTDTVGKFSCKP